MTHSECSWMKSRIVLALSVSDLRPPGLSQASESRSRWASPYCDVKTRARVVLPEPELPNTTMRHITFETARLTRPKISDRWRKRVSLQVECGSHRKLEGKAASGSLHRLVRPRVRGKPLRCCVRPDQ